ncbi:M56 family metallopeptidase, partial [Armatimonas sp.]|uniref:M56 family metallopeptidase n=1 Tax=Armatimonas sp. TaxID=1872638 RepID=UPI0037504B29
MLLFFTELLVRGTALCLLIALALLLLRRAAATYRHLLCTLALCGLLTLPLVQELLPPLPLLEAAKPFAIAAPVAPVVIYEPISPAPEPIPQSLPSAPRGYPGRGEDPPKPFLGQGGWLGAKNERRAGWVLACWALGATLLLARLAVALVRLRGLATRSQRTTLLETEILVSGIVTTPLTWGVRRPVILLPAALLTGDPAVAESALRHEKAHIARRDWLWHLLAEAVCALCWFQPGAWWLRRRLRAESERACDDQVLLSGVSGPDYAAHLLEILKAGRASALAPGMAAVGSMELRVKHILDPKKPRRAHGLRLALTAVLGLILLPLASLKVAAKPGERPVSRLQAAVELLAPKVAFLTPSALLAQARAILVAPKPLEPMPLVEPTLAQPNGTLAMPQPLAPPQGSPATEPPGAPKAPDTTISFKDVHWGTAVDGLEPGFLLTGVADILDELGTLEIGYTALVRNKTKQPITFLVRLLQYDGYDVPYTRNNTEDTKPPGPTERAKGVRHTDLGRDAVNLITLAPGESVLVPGQEAHHNLRVLIGSGDGGKSPYFAKIKEGMDMLVQPLTVYRSPDLTQLTRDLARYSVTKLAPDGTSRTESSVRVSMPDSGGTTLEAQLWLSKIRGTSAAPATSITTEEPGGPMIPLDKVVWNKAVDGLEAGLLLTSSPRVPMNSKLTYQTLVRNTSDKPISFMTRLLQYEGYDVPTVDGKPTKGAKRGYPVDPLYSVTLAPGE